MLICVVQTNIITCVINNLKLVYGLVNCEINFATLSSVSEVCVWILIGQP